MMSPNGAGTVLIWAIPLVVVLCVYSCVLACQVGEIQRMSQAKLVEISHYLPVGVSSVNCVSCFVVS